MTQVLDATTAECLVFTGKEGLLSAAAHDLKIRVERFQLRIEDGGVQAEFDAGSLRVVCARRGDRDAPNLLSAKDRAEIEANIAGKVLHARTYPAIHFRSTAVSDARVEGTLSLCGQERTVAVRLRRDGDRLVAECTVHQPDFGIQPYSAMFGALRVKAGVTVRMSVPAAALQL